MNSKRRANYWFSDCNRCGCGLFETQAVELLRAIRRGKKLSPELARRLADWEEWDGMTNKQREPK